VLNVFPYDLYPAVTQGTSVTADRETDDGRTDDNRTNSSTVT